MENAPQSVVNPVVKFLTEVLDEISSSELRVPNFQRPYVWKPSDAIALFDSIYKGYPIGSLLFWETTEELISFTRIGPFEIELDSRMEKNYVIDGHQRLSTLYGILKSKKNLDIREPDKWILYFDLDRNEFFFKTASMKIANYIAMDKIINTIDFLNECRRIQQDNPASAEFYVAKAQKLTQSIVTYKISITQIKKASLTGAVEIFSRLNTRGMDMTPDQMLSALTYQEGEQPFKLADKIDDILYSLVEYNFSEIERIFIFRAIIAASKRDIYNVKLDDLAKDPRLDLATIVQNCESSIIKAVRFFREMIGIPSDKFLPYNLQLVFLSEFYYVQPEPTVSQLDELYKWFWFTSYSAWFAGANSSKVRKGLDEIRSFALNHSPSILQSIEYTALTVPIPRKFDFRYARVKAFILFLNNLHPLSLSGHDDLSNILGEYSAKALHNILPNEVNSFANKMILGPLRSGMAKSELTGNSIFLSDEILQSHAIPLESIGALDSGSFSRFLQLREQELLRRERIFIEALGLNYTPSISQVETDDSQPNLFSYEDL